MAYEAILLFNVDEGADYVEEDTNPNNILVFDYARHDTKTYFLAKEIVQQGGFSIEYLKNTNVLYFGGKQYTLDFNERYPIKINYIEGSESTEGGSDGPLLSTINEDNTISAENTDLGDTIYIYKRRQLEIRHINANGDILILVVPFKSNKFHILTYDPILEGTDVTATGSYTSDFIVEGPLDTGSKSALVINDENNDITSSGLNLMHIIPNGNFYYKQYVGKTVIFFDEQTIDEAKAEELFDGSLRGVDQIRAQTPAPAIQWSGVWGDGGDLADNDPAEKYRLYHNFFYYGSNSSVLNGPISQNAVTADALEELERSTDPDQEIDPPYLGPWHLNIDPPENITKIDSRDPSVNLVVGGTFYNEQYINAFIVNTLDYNMNDLGDGGVPAHGGLPDTYFECEPVGASDETILTGISKDKYIDLDERINTKANKIITWINNHIPGWSWRDRMNPHIKPRRLETTEQTQTAGFTSRRKNNYSVHEGITEGYYPYNSINHSNVSGYENIYNMKHSIPQNCDDYYFEDAINKHNTEAFNGWGRSRRVIEGNTVCSTYDEQLDRYKADFALLGLPLPDDPVAVAADDASTAAAEKALAEQCAQNYDSVQANYLDYLDSKHEKAKRNADSADRRAAERAKTWKQGQCNDYSQSPKDYDFSSDNTRKRLRDRAKNRWQRCVRDPKCRVTKEADSSRITKYDDAAKSVYDAYYEITDSDYKYNESQDFLDLYNFGWRAGRSTQNKEGDIFRCKNIETNNISKLYLGIRNYIKHLLSKIYRKHSSFVIGLQIGLMMVISFNVLLNKILDKKKPKKETPP
mgnify:CR=1 FL=1